MLTGPSPAQLTVLGPCRVKVTVLVVMLPALSTPLTVMTLAPGKSALVGTVKTKLPWGSQVLVLKLVAGPVLVMCGEVACRVGRLGLESVGLRVDDIDAHLLVVGQAEILGLPAVGGVGVGVAQEGVGVVDVQGERQLQLAGVGRDGDVLVEA